MATCARAARDQRTARRLCHSRDGKSQLAALTCSDQADSRIGGFSPADFFSPLPGASKPGVIRGLRSFTGRGRWALLTAVALISLRCAFYRAFTFRRDVSDRASSASERPHPGASALQSDVIGQLMKCEGSCRKTRQTLTGNEESAGPQRGLCSVRPGGPWCRTCRRGQANFGWGGRDRCWGAGG